MQGMQPNIFYELHELEGKLRKKFPKKSYYNMAMASPQRKPFQPAVDFALEMIDETRYMDDMGLECLRRAFCEFYQRRYHVEVNPETEVQVTCGSKAGFAMVALALLEEGDRVVLPEPYFPPHYEVLHKIGVNIVSCSVEFDMMLEYVEKLCHSGYEPKMVVLNYPHNPTGSSAYLDGIVKLTELSRKFCFFIVNDFAYALTAWSKAGNAPSFLQASSSSLRFARHRNTIELFSMSKPYNLPGWRIGFVAANHIISRDVFSVRSNFEYGGLGPFQYAATEALTEAGSGFAYNESRIYKARAQMVMEILGKYDFTFPYIPEGGMFVWAKFPKIVVRGFANKVLVQLIAEETGVILTPGSAFGVSEHLKDYVRISTTWDERWGLAVVSERLDAVGKFVCQLSKDV